MNIYQTKLAWFVLWAGLFTGCAAPNQQLSGQGYIHHVVIVWLKKPGDQSAQQTLINATRSFKKIPGVVAVSAGTTFPSPRRVVDDSFDIALTIVLKDREALRNYQSHPLHQKVKREKLKPLVKRYRVYNFVD